MKECKDCNVKMIENCTLTGQHPFEIGVDGESDIFVQIPDGEKKSFLGFKYDSFDEHIVKARICPKCGKVELYIELKSEE